MVRRLPFSLDVAGRGKIDFCPQHVGRQYPVGFNQADEQGRRRHQRDDPHKIPDDTGQQRQREKHGCSRQHRGGNRRADFPEGFNNGRHAVQSPLQAVIHGFDHHYRIIDYHPQGNHYAQEHGIVQGKITGIENQESAGEGKQDAAAGDEGDAGAQEYPGNQQHQEKAEQRIGFHHRQRLPGTDGLVVRQEQLHPG